MFEKELATKVTSMMDLQSGTDVAFMYIQP